MNLYEIITTKQDPELVIALEQFVKELLPEFRQILLEHPVQTPSPGCLSVSEAFWLYGLVRSLNPEIIVESGSFEGYSLYFLYRAASSHTRIISFDPFVKPKIKLPNVEYYSMDWTRYQWRSLPGDQTLIFFDDHLHQGIRLKQACKRQIRYVLFHDNYITPIQSHVPIRYCNLLGLAKICYVFERLSYVDPIFRDTSINPQGYRWLTYIELDNNKSFWQRLIRYWRYSLSLNNPYKVR